MTPFTLSERGERITADSGIHALMRDLGSALERDDSPIMMGGGNPAHIPEVEAVFARHFAEMAKPGPRLAGLLGDYTSPEGQRDFREKVAAHLSREFGWNITWQNVAVTSGGQATFILLFMLLAGERGAVKRRILFPIAPEYIGYADQGMDPDSFCSCRPHMVETSPHRFRYEVDFAALEEVRDIAAICLSRPTNPSANVISDEELFRLSELAQRRQVPLIVDNAYGLPWPGVLFKETSLPWQEHWILSISLSKLGLPGLRSGLVIAHPWIIERLATMQSVAQLAPGTLGPAMLGSLLDSGEMSSIVQGVVRPFYQARCEAAVRLLDELLPNTVDWAIHEPGGAFFLWLRLRGLSGTSYELYERLKSHGLITVPGRYFFAGLSAPWEHTEECLRLSYCIPYDALRRGITLLAREIVKAV